MAYVFVLLAVVLLTAGQVAQKWVADTVLKNDLSRLVLHRLLTSPALWIAVLSLGCGTLMWLVALSSMELSTAYPILSLSFVLTVLSARLFLNEQVSLRRWAGAGLITFGAALLTAA